MAWHKTILRYLALSTQYFRNKKHLNIFPLPYNGPVRKLTWPQVTEIQIPRYTICRYWCPNQPLKVSCWSLKNCSHSAITNIFGGWVTWPDLVTWPEMTLSWNFQERCGKDVWKGMHKTAALRPPFFLYSRKTLGGRLDAPPTARRGLIIRMWGSRCWYHSFNKVRDVW